MGHFTILAIHISPSAGTVVSFIEDIGPICPWKAETVGPIIKPCSLNVICVKNRYTGHRFKVLSQVLYVATMLSRGNPFWTPTIPTGIKTGKRYWAARYFACHRNSFFNLINLYLEFHVAKKKRMNIEEESEMEWLKELIVLTHMFLHTALSNCRILGIGSVEKITICQYVPKQCFVTMRQPFRITDIYISSQPTCKQRVCCRYSRKQ